MIAVSLPECCLSNARSPCRNCRTSSGRQSELEYRVGDSKLGTTTRWTDVGAELATFVAISLRNALKGEVGSLDGLARVGMLMEGLNPIWPLISAGDRRFVKSNEWQNTPVEPEEEPICLCWASRIS